MMQAAQLAAEAAMREAAEAEARERNTSNGDSEQMRTLSMMDMMHGSAASFMSTTSDQFEGQMEYMQGMQHQQQYEYQGGYQQEQEYYDEQQYYHDQQHEPGSDDYNNQMLLQEMQMMGIDPSDPEGVQFFLQYLQQRKEQERQQADRPDEHYMTIAQNGKYKYLCNINLGLGISNWIKGHNSPRNFERHFCSTLLFPCGI